MWLKRHFKKIDGGGVALDHVKVLTSVDIGEIQKFTPKRIDEMQACGLMKVEQDLVTLNTVPILTFKIVRRPGYFCCFDDAPMDTGGTARAYIEKNFPGKPSPDAGNPSGYRRDNFYACVRVS